MEGLSVGPASTLEAPGDLKNDLCPGQMPRDSFICIHSRYEMGLPASEWFRRTPGDLDVPSGLRVS